MPFVFQKTDLSNKSVKLIVILVHLLHEGETRNEVYTDR